MTTWPEVLAEQSSLSADQPLRMSVLLLGAQCPPGPPRGVHRPCLPPPTASLGQAGNEQGKRPQGCLKLLRQNDVEGCFNDLVLEAPFKDLPLLSLLKVYPHGGPGAPQQSQGAPGLEDTNHLTPIALPEFWEEGQIKGPPVPTRRTKSEGQRKLWTRPRIRRAWPWSQWPRSSEE